MTVELPSELTIGHAEELRALLLSVLEEGRPLELSGTAVVEVDVAGLQVLCAARRSAAARNLACTLPIVVRSAALRRAIATAGLDRSEADRWLGEECR